MELLMKKHKEFGLNTITDLKVFILFLLDNIRYPIEHTTVKKIVEENVDDISLDFEECLAELTDSGHLLFDEIDSEKYYMISDKGRAVAGELYDTLDKGFRERSLRSATKYISLSRSEATIRSYITQTATGRFTVHMEVRDKREEIMSVSLTVTTRAEAEKIKKNFENKPDGVYRGTLFAATGRLDFLS
jgi:hypothetical protein